MTVKKQPIRTDKIREAVARMPEIDETMLSPELQEQLSGVRETLAELQHVLDEYDAEQHQFSR